MGLPRFDKSGRAIPHFPCLCEADEVSRSNLKVII
jgi:hypothetical protein